MGFGPVDYSDAFAGATPFQSLAQGYQLGTGIRNDQQQQVLQTQQQQAQQAQSQVLSRLISNPNATATDYANAALLVPGMKDQIKQGWDARNAEQQEAHLSDVGQYFAAVQNGSPELAVSLMNRRANAMEASGADPNSVRFLRTNAQVLEAHPQFGKTMLGMMLASIPGGEKVIAGATNLTADQRAQQKQPLEVQKLGAEASQESTKANVAAATAPADVQTPGLKNENLRQDALTAESQRRIADLNVQIGQADSETKRGQLRLERDKLVTEQTLKLQAQGTAAQDAQNQSTAALETLSEITKHPAMTGWNRPGEWSGEMMKRLPTSERAALETHVETLKGQLAYSNLMAAKASSPTGASGFGALSDKELGLLSSLAGNLNTASKDFPQQLSRVERYLTKAQATTVARPGLPTTGEAFVMKHPSYGNVTEGRINQLMTQNPGSTRQQVLQFLQSSGGK